MFVVILLGVSVFFAGDTVPFFSGETTGTLIFIAIIGFGVIILTELME